jgi:hypothetical protein
MSEWHLAPDDINERETEERLALLFRARNRRIERLNAAMSGETYQTPGEVRMTMSDVELFNKMGINLQEGANA